MSDPGPDASPDVRVLVAGASGLTGALATDLVWRHPRLELAAATSRSEIGTRLDVLHPARRAPVELSDLESVPFDDLDAAIVAYPHAAAAPVVEALRGAGVRVCDLSADFRLSDPEVYSQWYGEHPAVDLLAEAVYGLPEVNRESVADADLVANPGCYPTATLISLLPLLEESIVEEVVVDAKSGASGAGRPDRESLGFVNVDENVRPYGVEGHRHQPEISEQMARVSGSEVKLTFVPHLLPLEQGELVSCYPRFSREVSAEELTGMYSDRFRDEPFVEMLDRPPGVREVRDTNLCRIFVAPGPDSRSALVFASIDNLWKGAASQAIQNLNLMFGFDETEGIG